jgi:hypothetical protein
MEAAATTVFPQFGSASGMGVTKAATAIVAKHSTTSSLFRFNIDINHPVINVSLSERLA